MASLPLRPGPHDISPIIPAGSKRERQGVRLVNRSSGRRSGQLRIRVRHAKTIAPWSDDLLVSRKKLDEILSRSAWQVDRIISDKGPGHNHGAEDPGYAMVLKKRR